MTERAPVRIAMWSGPRNISTAMMRSWENRPDRSSSTSRSTPTTWPRPASTTPARRGHRAASQPTGARSSPGSTGPMPGGATVFYQKHMAHHLLPDVDRGWLAPLTHAFLIRDPREMLAVLRQGARASRRWTTPGCRSRSSSSNCSAVGGAGASTPRRAPRPARRCWRCSARRSASPFDEAMLVLAGRAAADTTASGRSTGTPASSARPASSRTSPTPTPTCPTT